MAGKLPRVSEISYKRYIFNEANIPMLPEELFLHVFCDAAEAAFGIAAYIRYKYEGVYKSHLIFSSSKMAPSKNKLSIPKKELNAILLGCIKGDYLIKILNIPRKNIILHTDSAVCFHWIQTNYEKLKVYVSNRVQKIQKYDFKIIYVPGEMNPADFVTKKTNIEKYLNNPFWQHGPEFLDETNENILGMFKNINISDPVNKEEADKELRQKLKRKNQIVKSNKFLLSGLIYNWSNFYKILRVTSFA